jgi:hypothetical protein
VRALAESLVVAFDASSVSGAVSVRGLAGRRLKTLARLPLSEGALVPGTVDTNVRRPEEVRSAAERVAEELGASGQPACLLLPDGVGRVVLLEPPRGVEAREYARFRLGPSLPYPETEASIDVLPLGDGRFLAAGVRRAVAGEYETVAAEAGIKQGRLDLMPLAAVGGRLRHRGSRASEVEVVLGDAALSLAVYRDGELRAFRGRRRDVGPDEAARVAQEADRTTHLAGNGTPPRLRVVGSGAAALARALDEAGRAAEVGLAWSPQGLPPDASELGWLAAVLA